MMIFNKFFLKSNIESSLAHDKYEFMQNSYQGGYTQAFIHGDYGKDSSVFYLDYNSMYPSIMAKIMVPTNLNQCQIE